MNAAEADRASSTRVGRPRARTLLLLVAIGFVVAFAAACEDPATRPFASDDFSDGYVRSDWTVVDPVGDGSVAVTGHGTSDARLELSVPAGVDHQPWTENRSLRAMQQVGNLDLGLEAKFDSVPTQRFQEQGLLVEEDADSYLRFEVYSDGSSLRAYVARILDGTASTVANVVIPGGSSVWNRVQRTGDTWTYQTSANGSTWSTRATFVQALSVTRAGVYAGNAGSGGNPAPAWTAAVDYVFNTASPIVPEDPVQDLNTVTTPVVGEGEVLRYPPTAAYADDQPFLLLAEPAVGWQFDGWSGDVTSSEPVLDMSTTEDLEITATFSLIPDAQPPTISDVSFEEISPTSAVVRWTTDEPATSSVAFGPTSAYEDGIVSDPAFVTDHQVELTGLDPGTTYHVQVSSLDPAGNPAVDVDRTFTTATTPMFVSDDFSTGVLGPQWTVSDPVGDGSVGLVGAGTSDARLSLAVPAGVAHEPWAPDTSLSVVQDAPDTDVVLEAKFDSIPTTAYQEQGIVVRGEGGTLLRFEIHHNGTSLRAYAAKVVGGTPSTIASVNAAAGSSVWLRVTRTGDTWVFDTSADGATWLTRAVFGQAVTVTEAGVYAGNYSSSGSPPAWTALVDYVFDASSPVVPEDPIGTLVGLTTDVVGQGSIQRVPDQAEYLEGSTVQLTAVPAPGWQFTGWSGDASGTTNPVDVTMSVPRAVTATFEEMVDEDPPAISGVQVTSLQTTSAVIGFSTDEITTASVDYGTSTAYEYPAVDQPVYAFDHAVTLSGLAPGTTYHYQVTATDPSSNSTVDVDRTFTTPPSSPDGPTFDVWYGSDQQFGVPALAQRWVNVLGTVTDPQGVSNLSYRVNGGSPVQMGIGPNGRRLVGPGDFNVDLLATSLVPGPNSVVLTAIDGLGNASATTVTVRLQAGGSWPLPYDPDLAGPVAPTDVGQVVDGDWEITGGELSTVDTALGYDRLVAVGDATWTDYEASFTMTVNSLESPTGPNSGAPAAGFLFRWSGHNQAGSGSQPQQGYVPNGTSEPTPFGAYGLWRAGTGGGRLELRDHYAAIEATDASFDLVLGQTYRVRAQADTDPGTGLTTYRFRVWADGTPEPVVWNVQYVAGTGTGEPAAGSLVLLAHEADVDFGDLLVAPLP